MPLIIPIKDLKNTSEISELAHKEQEPIFITKNIMDKYNVKLNKHALRDIDSIFDCIVLEK